jgi:hypothetical protein
MKNCQTFSGLRRIIIFLSIVSVFVNGNLLAQTSAHAFEKTTLSLSIGSKTNESLFDDYWEQSPAVEIIMEFPFYYGVVQSGLQVANNKAIPENASSFVSAYFYIGWGIKIDLPFRLSWLNSIQAGNYGMWFEKWQGSYSTEDRESEFFAGIFSKVSYPVKNNWRLNVSFSSRKIYSRRRIYQSFVAAGAGYNFKTPDWLAEFLR